MFKFLAILLLLFITLNTADIATYLGRIAKTMEQSQEKR